MVHTTGLTPVCSFLMQTKCSCATSQFQVDLLCEIFTFRRAREERENCMRVFVFFSEIDKANVVL